MNATQSFHALPLRSAHPQLLDISHFPTEPAVKAGEMTSPRGAGQRVVRHPPKMLLKSGFESQSRGVRLKLDSVLRSFSQVSVSSSKTHLLRMRKSADVKDTPPHQSACSTVLSLLPSTTSLDVPRTPSRHGGLYRSKSDVHFRPRNFSQATASGRQWNDVSSPMIKPSSSYQLRHRDDVLAQAQLNFVESLNVEPKTIHYRERELGYPVHLRGLNYNLHDHPLPEVLSDDFSDGYTKSSYASSTSSVASQPYQYREADSLTSSQSWPATGNTTERSSTYSLNEDDYDRTAAQQVKRLFDNIDRYMFENEQDNGPKNLTTECKEWMSHFPHLRIVGQQLVEPSDRGFEYVSTTGTPSSAISDWSDHTGLELAVTGRHVNSWDQGQGHRNTDNNDYSEEVLAEDGLIEDIIAVDNSPYDDDVKSSVTRARARQKSGLPPMTPQACVRDNLYGAVFDSIWTEVVHWVRPLHSQLIVSPRVPSSPEDGDLTPPGPLPLSRDSNRPYKMDDLPMAFQLLQTNPTLLTSGLSPRAHTYDDLYHKTLTSREEKMRQTGGSSQKHPNEPLSSLLSVSMVPIFPRERTALPENEQAVIPKTTQAIPSSASRTGQRKGFFGPGRLAPLDQHTRPPYMDNDPRQLTDLDIKINGVKLGTPTDLFAVQPIHYGPARNGQLPPLEREMSDSLARNKRKSTQPNNRASSAAVHEQLDHRTVVHNSAQRSTLQQTTQGTDSRPNTTHAYRGSDVNNRRASTPMGQQGTRPNDANTRRGTHGHYSTGTQKRGVIGVKNKT